MYVHITPGLTRTPPLHAGYVSSMGGNSQEWLCSAHHFIKFIDTRIQDGLHIWICQSAFVARVTVWVRAMLHVPALAQGIDEHIEAHFGKDCAFKHCP